MYGVNSYTSKLNKGVNKPEFWVTSQKVEPAFHLAQRLAKIVYQHKHLIELPPKKSAWNKLPLFPQATAFKEQKSSIFDYTKSSLDAVGARLREWASQPQHDGAFVIDKDDMKTVLALDPDADWEDRKRIAESLVWPFAPHQFRRSLIVYASKAGVSLNVLKGVAKHLNEAMTEYYGRGSVYVEGLALKRSKDTKGVAEFIVEFSEEQIETEATQIQAMLQDVADDAQTYFGVRVPASRRSRHGQN